LAHHAAIVEVIGPSGWRALRRVAMLTLPSLKAALGSNADPRSLMARDLACHQPGPIGHPRRLRHPDFAALMGRVRNVLQRDAS
jgi:hypothetical protein